GRLSNGSTTRVGTSAPGASPLLTTDFIAGGYTCRRHTTILSSRFHGTAKRASLGSTGKRRPPQYDRRGFQIGTRTVRRSCRGEKSSGYPGRCRTVSPQAESGSAAVAREEYFNAVRGRRRQTVRIPLSSRRAGPADDEPVLARREF